MSRRKTVSRRKTASIITTAGLAIGTLAAAAPAIATTHTVGASAATIAGPEIKLITAQHSFSVTGFPFKKGSKQLLVFLDPGIWLASLGSALQFDVARAGYAKPMTLTQIISRPGRAPLARPLPANMLNSWNGLKGMLSLSIRDKAGKVVSREGLTTCPNTFDSERATPDSPAVSPYPQQCFSFDPFPLSEVWGIAKGWAVNPVENSFTLFKLFPGTYKVTESITARYRNWFHIPARNATASVKITVQAPANGGPPPPPVASRPRGTALPELPAAPLLRNPPKSVLPDLVPLPAWGMGVQNASKHDYLNFSATVWVGGNGPLDVEAFRSNASPVMPAYQYFYRNGTIIGRVRAGTMGFDSAPGHTHWHFQQFAQYRLLSATKKLAIRSQKVGFCIAPTDPVDLLLRHAVWQPSFIGFGGQCGSPTALWVREAMPLGWGDTYQQFLAGQAFDITNLPNGVYYVQVIANPGHVLRETSFANDVSLRKIIISGTKGHRHVVVPAFHGIDREG